MREFSFYKWIALLFALPLAWLRSVFTPTSPTDFLERVNRFFSFFPFRVFFSLYKVNSPYATISYCMQERTNIEDADNRKIKILKNE
jgi:hypothetical protein